MWASDEGVNIYYTRQLKVVPVTVPLSSSGAA
jgi:hypothetical protein